MKAKNIIICFVALLMLASCQKKQTVNSVQNYDTEDEKAVFRTVYKGMTIPVVVNSFELYSDYASINLCNITEESINEIIFSYTIFDENDKKLFSISKKLAHEIAPYVTSEIHIENPKNVSGWTETIKNKSIRIIFESGRETELSDEDINSSIENSLHFCLYKDENLAVFWQYNLEAGTYLMKFESKTLFDYSYFCFKTDEYEDIDGTTLDSIEGAFFYDDYIVKEGDVYSETVKMPNYLEDMFETTKSLEIYYLMKTTDESAQCNLPEAERRNRSKKIIINDTASLERIRAFASFMNIMGLR